MRRSVDSSSSPPATLTTASSRRRSTGGADDPDGGTGPADVAPSPVTAATSGSPRFVLHLGQRHRGGSCSPAIASRYVIPATGGAGRAAEEDGEEEDDAAPAGP